MRVKYESAAPVWSGRRRGDPSSLVQFWMLVPRPRRIRDVQAPLQTGQKPARSRGRLGPALQRIALALRSESRIDAWSIGLALRIGSKGGQVAP